VDESEPGGLGQRRGAWSLGPGGLSTGDNGWGSEVEEGKKRFVDFSGSGQRLMHAVRPPPIWRGERPFNQLRREWTLWWWTGGCGGSGGGGIGAD
jgi:hypothetical protein